jgi:hypothetical protein
MYRFGVLDPRSVPAAVEANEKVFAAECGICLHASGQLDGETCRYCGGTGRAPVYGVEVTVPALVKRCAFNLDPQHSGGDANRAAIEDSLTIELPADGSILATVRADLDAVGSMAVFNLRANGVSLEPATERIAMVATSDKFARGGYTGPKPLPTRDNPWIEETATAESSRELAAIAAAVMDFKVPLADRVATMEKWLLTADEPKQYRDSVEKERLDMIIALETGQIKHETRSGGRIAVVESTHRAATSVGYSLAPVVVALNPSFKQGPSEPYKKFTICQFAGEFSDIKAALVELNELENGWGGSPTIGGSPQGVSSRLTIDEVVAVVEKYLS